MKRDGVTLAALLLALVAGAGTAWLGLSPNRSALSLACPAGAQPMQRLELVFGLSRKGRVDVSEAEWALFLDREVTPRFPDGLTVLAGSGQWRNKTGVVIREPSRILLVWVTPAADLDARVEAVREAWKSAQAQESVLRANGASCVAF
jgi:hypothetical protein